MVLNKLRQIGQDVKWFAQEQHKKKELNFNTKLDKEMAKNKRLLEAEKLRYERAKIQSKMEHINRGERLDGRKLTSKIKESIGKVREPDDYKRINF